MVISLTKWKEDMCISTFLLLMTQQKSIQECNGMLCNISKSAPLKRFRIIAIVVAAMCFCFLSEKRIFKKIFISFMCTTLQFNICINYKVVINTNLGVIHPFHSPLNCRPVWKPLIFHYINKLCYFFSRLCWLFGIFCRFIC